MSSINDEDSKHKTVETPPIASSSEHNHAVAEEEADSASHRDYSMGIQMKGRGLYEDENPSHPHPNNTIHYHGYGKTNPMYGPKSYQNEVSLEAIKDGGGGGVGGSVSVGGVPSNSGQGDLSVPYQQQQQQPQQSLYQQHQQPQPYYYNYQQHPDYHPHDDTYPHQHHQVWTYNSTHPSLNEPSCYCSPISCLTNFLTAENLHRSFCFGAIDGLLTGSGIAAASCGLGLFDPYAPLPSRLLIVALSFAACAADGLCMGIGHIWSTYILQEGVTKEKEIEKANIRFRRGECKARLVDALLMRGMLKIDAMSVADTLEGYPDIFLSALIGNDGGGAGGAGAVSFLAGSGDFSRTKYVASEQPQMTSLGFQRTDSMYEEEEEACGDTAVVRDSRNEGVVMMFAFSVFSVLPALIYAFVPIWLNPKGGWNDEYYKYADKGVSATTVTVCLNGLVMLLLGFWKSKFFSSSWIVFGIETVLVLILCIMSAYALGAVMGSAINN